MTAFSSPNLVSASKGLSQRQLKVGEQIRQILSEVIAKNSIHNDVLEQTHVCISEVRMSPDLRLGKAYITSLMGASMDAAVAALNENEFHFRKKLSRELSMKFLPKIRFLIDDTFFEANKIQSLLSQETVRQDIEAPDQVCQESEDQ